MIYEHGERQRYLDGCRCDVCRAAEATYMRNRNRNNPHVRERNKLNRLRRTAALAQAAKDREASVLRLRERGEI